MSGVSCAMAMDSLPEPAHQPHPRTGIWRTFRSAARVKARVRPSLNETESRQSILTQCSANTHQARVALDSEEHAALTCPIAIAFGAYAQCRCTYIWRQYSGEAI